MKRLGHRPLHVLVPVGHDVERHRAVLHHAEQQGEGKFTDRSRDRFALADHGLNLLRDGFYWEGLCDQVQKDPYIPGSDGGEQSVEVAAALALVDGGGEVV